MINVPYDQILTAIQEKSSLPKEEIEQKIKAKLDQLSGLISKEGAAHIIANELGIQLNATAQSPTEAKCKINEVTATSKNVQIVGRVVQKYELREFNSNGREGKVANFLLGDETGVMRIVMWNAVADNLAKLKEKDIVKISGAYARMNNTRVELHLNDNSVLDINPAGEDSPQITRQSSEFTRKKITELSEADQEVEILGTIVQVFDPRFFEVDPNSGKRIRPREDNIFYNETGQPINPDYSYVFNLFVDDGTDNMRVVCFKNQMQRVLDKGHEDILEFRTNPQSFETAKHDLLGKMVKIQGRIVRNEMFDRLEMISSRIFTDVNPQDELNRMNDSSKTASSEKKSSEEPKSVPKPVDSSSVISSAAAAVPAAMSLDDLESNTDSEDETEEVESSSTLDEDYTPDVSNVPKDQLDFKSGSEVSEPEDTDLDDMNSDDSEPIQKKQALEESDELGELDDLEELDSFDDDM